ncbi:hypothetical protein [Microvirga lotononidis]|nr:hypothetical protein [Microvirga lotononidis]WQO31886.1 hypothetical protein U0023_31585 [Microvirga lotononidis]
MPVSSRADCAPDQHERNLPQEVPRAFAGAVLDRERYRSASRWNAMGFAMTLQDFAWLATTISGIGVIFTLIIFSIQIRENTRAVRASTFQQVVNSFASISFDIARDRSLVDLYIRAGRDFTALNEAERVQYSFMLLSFLRRAENVYVQSEIRTIHAPHWSGIRESNKAVMASPGARACWSEIRNRHNPHFRAFIDELIAEDAGSGERDWRLDAVRVRMG